MKCPGLYDMGLWQPHYTLTRGSSVIDLYLTGESNMSQKYNLRFHESMTMTQQFMWTAHPKSQKWNLLMQALFVKEIKIRMGLEFNVSAYVQVQRMFIILFPSILAPSQLSREHVVLQPVTQTALAYWQDFSLPLARYSFTASRVSLVRWNALS